MMWFVASSLLFSMPACKDHRAIMLLQALASPLLCAWEPSVPHLQLTKVAPSGGLNHTSVNTVIKWKSRAGP